MGKPSGSVVGDGLTNLRFRARAGDGAIAESLYARRNAPDSVSFDADAVAAMHAMQFALSRNSRSPIADWPSRPIGDGWWIHHCRRLPVWSSLAADGKPVALAGWAAELVEGEMEPLAQISALASHELVRRYRSWAGRWILVVDGHVHGDATCSIPVFFGREFVSSSLRLIQNSTGAESRPDCRMRYGVGPDWYPGPRTPILGVSRLLPSQTLHLATMTPRHRPMLCALSVTDPAQQLGTALVTGTRKLAAGQRDIFVALTGGLDSRTVLACGYAAGLRPSTYTQDYPGLSPGDRRLPSLLAQRLSLTHRLIARADYDAHKALIFDEHSQSQCIGADRSFYAHGQWNALPEGSLVLRGGGFEFGRAFYYRKISKDFDPAVPDAAGRLHRMLYHPLSSLAPRLAAALQRRQSFMTESLTDWLSWVNLHPEPGLDFRDRLYLEQRLGCWLATMEQALDLTKTVRIHISNSHYVMSLMNLASEDERRRGFYQKRIIDTLAPDIAPLPYNPMSKWRRVRQKGLGNLGRIRAAISFLRQTAQSKPTHGRSASIGT